jgi:hypothetical protein
MRIFLLKSIRTTLVSVCFNARSSQPLSVRQFNIQGTRLYIHPSLVLSAILSRGASAMRISVEDVQTTLTTSAIK